MPVASDVGGIKRDTEVDSDALPINEHFYSLQGEGKLTGVPSVFIRTSGCNLRCWFCDSFHTSWKPQGSWLTVDEIVEELQSYENAQHVVLTGGEPLMHEKSVDLLDRVSELGYHTTVETNGTIYRDADIDLASISPKLESSTPTPERDPAGDGEWEDRHEEDRIDIGVLSQLVDSYNSQLKFVVTGQKDLPEIETLLERIQSYCGIQIESDDVLLMPEGTTRDELDKRRHDVAELAMEHGYRYTPRIHVELWNDEPGT